MAVFAESRITAPKLEVALRYLDKLPHVLPSAVLYWSDSVSKQDLGGAPAPWVANEDLGFVVRMASIQIVNRDVISRNYFKDSVSVQSFLYSVGRTSYKIYVEIRDSVKNMLVAKLWSTCICVDKATITPVSFPQKDGLVVLQHVPPAPAKPPVSFPAEEPLYQWKTVLRITECDRLKHINNTKYPLFAEEALAQAREAGAFDYHEEIKALSNREVRRMDIEFIDQALPFNELTVSIWFDEPSRAFLQRFESCGKTISEVILYRDDAKSHL